MPACSASPASSWADPDLLLLLPVPEHRRRRLEIAGDAGSDRRRHVELAELDVRWILRHADLDRRSEVLAPGVVGCLGESVAQLLELGVARPADGRLLAIG